MDKIPNSNQSGGFWWLFKSKQNQTNITSNKEINKNPPKTNIESVPWWKFWESDSESEKEFINSKEFLNKKDSPATNKKSNATNKKSPATNKQDNPTNENLIKKNIPVNTSKEIKVVNTSKKSNQNLEKKIIAVNTSIENNQNFEKVMPIKSPINKKFDTFNLNIKINQIENEINNINNNEIQKNEIERNETIVYNKEVKLFLSSICSHKLKDTVLNNLKNLINTNLKLYEQNPVKLSILKYRLCNNISNNEKIGKFFFDIGYNDTVLNTEINNFKLDYIVDTNNLSQKREVIIINEDSDVNLRDMITKIKIFEKDDNLYINIIRLIITYMGEDCDDFIFNKFMQTYSYEYKTNFLKIGDIDCGLDRHKSLLFKYLCDILNLQCSLFRNVKTDCNNYIFDDHIWNLILIKGKIYVVDFRYFPNKIVCPKNIETSKYYKIIRFVL